MSVAHVDVVNDFSSVASDLSCYSEVERERDVLGRGGDHEDEVNKGTSTFLLLSLLLLLLFFCSGATLLEAGDM